MRDKEFKMTWSDTTEQLMKENIDLKKRVDDLEASQADVKHKDQVWPFLEAASRGCISGNINEWPQLKPALKWSFETIRNLQSRLDLAKEALEHLKKGWSKWEVAKYSKDFRMVEDALTKLKEKS